MNFISKTPLWVYLTLFVGLIWPIVITAIIRKNVTSQSWPVCSKCGDERRQNFIWMWVSIGSWLPGVVVLANLPSNVPGLLAIPLFFLVFMGPVFAAVWFHGRANWGHRVGGEVSADGMTVSFPARVFPQPRAAAIKTAPSDDPAAFFGG